MAIIKTHLYNISFESQDIIASLIVINKLRDRVFPIDSQKIVNKVKGVSILDRTNPYNEVYDKLKQIYTDLAIAIDYEKNVYNEIDLEKTAEFIAKVQEEIKNVLKIQQEFKDERQENIGAIKLITHLNKSKVSLDSLQETTFIDVRFGTMPVEQLKKLKYYSSLNFVYRILDQDSETAWLFYCALKNQISEIDNMFYSLSFDLVKLPDFTHGTIEEALLELHQEVDSMDQYIDQMNNKLKEIKEKYQTELTKAYSDVANLKDLYDQNKYVVDFSHKAAIYAFSGENIETITNQFQHIKSVRIMELPATIYLDRNIIPPVLVHNNWFYSPFETLIKNQLGDKFDATIWLGTIIMLAGALFIGDIGLGVVILIIAGILKALHHKTGFAIMSRIGVAVILGGLFYGTVFYRELYVTPFDGAFKYLHSYIIFIVFGVVSYLSLRLLKRITREKFKG